MMKMRKLLLGVAAVSLSGCSFLGIGGHSKHDGYYDKSTGYYGSTHAPKECYSDSCMSRWNLEGGIGPSFIVGGDAVTGSGTNAGSGAAINDISMNDAYDTGLRVELGGSYALKPNTKITGFVFNEKHDSAGRFDWGTLNDERVSGALSDYDATGVELGLRHYFAPRRGFIVQSVRPYVEGRLGAARLDGVEIEGLRVGDTQLGDVNFTESGWVGSAAGLVGIETPLTKYSTIGLETGIRYNGEPKSNTTNFGPGNPLAGINNGGDRVSIPLMLRGRYRF